MWWILYMKEEAHPKTIWSWVKLTDPQLSWEEVQIAGPPKKDQLRRAITHAQVLNFVTWGEKPVRSLNRLDAFPTTACYTHCAAPWQVWGNIHSYDDAMLKNKVIAKLRIEHMINNCFYHAFNTTCTVQSVRQVPQCDEYPLITRTARQSDRFHWWRLLGDYSFIINNSIQYLGM